jgi:hypothetical protein
VGKTTTLRVHRRLDEETAREEHEATLVRGGRRRARKRVAAERPTEARRAVCLTSREHRRTLGALEEAEHALLLRLGDQRVEFFTMLGSSWT